MLGNVRCRADGDIERLAVSAERQIAHPVISAGRKVHQLFRFAEQFRRSRLKREGKHGIVIGNVKLAIAEGHSRGGGQVRFAKHEALFSCAVRIGVAQQYNTIGRGSTRTDPTHELHHHPGLEPAAARRRICFGHQYVAIGQGQHGARVIELPGKAGDDKTLCTNGFFTFGPTGRLGQADARQALRVWLHQRRIPAHRIGNRTIGGIAHQRPGNETAK